MSTNQLPSFMTAVSTTAPQEELPYDGSTYSLTLTDTNNVILLFENIPFGDYYLEELEAPDGYKADTTPYVFSVTADGQKIEIRRENTRIPGSVTVAKTDSSGNPIPGAAFRLEYSEDGETWMPVFHADVPAKEIGGCTSESLSDGMLITGDDGIAVFVKNFSGNRSRAPLFGLGLLCGRLGDFLQQYDFHIPEFSRGLRKYSFKN